MIALGIALILLVLLVGFDLAAWRWGIDSRDGGPRHHYER